MSEDTHTVSADTYSVSRNPHNDRSHHTVSEDTHTVSEDTYTMSEEIRTVTNHHAVSEDTQCQNARHGVRKTPHSVRRHP